MDETQQGQDGQPADPYIESLVNMDGESAKRMSDSLYHAAPVTALTQLTPSQRKNQGLMTRLYDSAAGYRDDVLRGMVKGYDQLGRTIAGNYADFLGKQGPALTPKMQEKFGMKARDPEAAPIMQEFRAIQRDGMVTARKALDLLGPDNDGMMHQFVEGAAQFAFGNKALGFMPAGKAGVAKVVGHLARGAAVDAFAFDPRAERLSSVLQGLPVVGPLAARLVSKPDDSEAVARFKASLEGTLTSATIDMVVHGLTKGGGKAWSRFKGKDGDMPALADFSNDEFAKVDNTEQAAKAREPFQVSQAENGQYTVEPKQAAHAGEVAELPHFESAAQAETVAASLNYKVENSLRPRLDLTEQQSSYLSSLARWIHKTGKYEDFQTGTLDLTTGDRLGGAHDVNFAYDLEPEQIGSIMSSMSTVLRGEIESARVPQSLMRDAQGGKHIGNAETVAKAVQDFGGKTPGAVQSYGHDIADAVDQAPSVLTAARILRSNIAQSAQQLATQMEANPDNPIAHREFMKAANSLMNTFVVEKRLASGGGRLLQANKIRVGVNGAEVDAASLGRALGEGKINPLDVMHFELLDEPHTAEGLAEIEGALKKDAKAKARVAENGGENPDVADMAIPAEHPDKVKGNAIGANTYTLVDEAQAKIDKAIQSLNAAKTTRELSAKAQDGKVLSAVRKDKGLMESARTSLGITEEDAKLAKERLRAAHNIAAEKRASGATDALAGLSHDELNDVASIDAERIRRLADAQRETPLVDPNPPKPAEPKAKGEPKDSPNVGTNTFTVNDEAAHRIAEGERKIDETLKAQAKMTPEELAARQDKIAARKLPAHDPERVTAAVDWMGGSDEDVKLAKERLEAIKQTLADKREQAGINVVDWSRYSDVELDDLAMMHGERIMKLAQEQRERPMVPRRERTVYLTKQQARAMARQITYFPRDEKQRGQVLEAILGMGRKATENAADAPSSVWDDAVSYRAWAMLSAPTTAEVNFFSAVSTALYRPMEGFAGALAQGDKAGMRRNVDLFTGTLKSFSDAMQVARASFTEGKSILSARDNAVPQVGLNRSHFSRKLSAALGDNAEQGEEIAQNIDKMLGWANVGARLMTAGDEFAQQIAYRGVQYAQSLERGRTAGVTGDALASMVNDDLSRAFKDDGGAMNPAALSYAQDVTLRRPLEGPIGKMLESGARNSKLMRVLFPFIRIPANLVRYQMDRAPGIGAFTKRNVEDFAAGGAQRNEMVGRQVTGALFWSSGLIMADAGVITGGGPRDPELRRQWLNVYQPYSVKIGNEWISYRRFEPLSTPLGIMADFHQILGEMDADGSDKDTSEVVTGFMAAMAANLTSKTYLKSMSDFFYALGSGKASAFDQFADGVVGSLVPNVVTKADTDDSMRQTRGLLDKLQSRVPGLSSELEPRRNIYGEKVMKPGSQFQRMFNPFTVRSDKADAVDVELLRVGAGMAMPQPRKYGVDMADRTLGVNGQSPYDRWMELMSKPMDGEPALRDKLREFVQSDDYKQLTDNANGYNGTRLLGVEKIVRAYRSAAFAKMVQENPKVMQAIVTAAGKRGAALSGDPDVSEALVGTAATSSAQQKGHAAEAAALLGQ